MMLRSKRAFVTQVWRSGLSACDVTQWCDDPDSVRCSLSMRRSWLYIVTLYATAWWPGTWDCTAVLRVYCGWGEFVLGYCHYTEVSNNSRTCYIVFVAFQNCKQFLRQTKSTIVRDLKWNMFQIVILCLNSPWRSESRER